MKNIILFTSLILNVIVCIAQQEKRFRYPETVELQAAEYVAPPIYNYEFLKTESYGNALDPEEVVNIDLKIKNRGEGPGENISIEVSTKDPITGLKINYPTTTFDIAPGHSVIQRITLTGEINLEQKESKLEIKLTESRGLAPSIPLIPIKTARFKEPKIILVQALFANKDQTPLKTKEAITITALLKNVGEGTAENVSLDIGYDPLIQSLDRKNSRSITSLQPGESIKKAFNFIAVEAFNKDSIIVTLTASERFSKYGFQTKVGEPINSKSVDDDLSNLLSSEEEVKEVVYNDVRLVSDVDVDIPITSIKRPNALALVIGNKNYENFPKSKLPYAHSDAKTVRNYLMNTLGYDSTNITIILDAETNDFTHYLGKEKGDIKQTELNFQLKQRSGQINELFVYYSGHGVQEKKSDESDAESYFITADTRTTISSSAYPTEVFYNNLYEIGLENSIDKTTIVLDACFSGTSIQEDRVKTRGVIGAKEDIHSIKNGILFASSKGNQESLDFPEKNHGLFTYFFLKSFVEAEDVDKNGVISYQEAYNYIWKKVDGKAIELRKYQMPILNGNNKDSAFFEK
jgi:hypothetical protein